MVRISRIYPITAFWMLILFSPFSNAIIINNYTALYEDGSKLVVDLKGYDYGQGLYDAPSVSWDEGGVYTEGFDTFFYPSIAFQNAIPWIDGGKVESSYYDGLRFEVDSNYMVSMLSISYIFSVPDWGITDGGIGANYSDYTADFSGGFFQTYIPPYEVGEPEGLALIIIGIASLGWARRFRKS